MELDCAQTDRAAGVLLGMACGDALGAGYKFGGPLPDEEFVMMKGGGRFGWQPGEWSDDTSMAIPIARAAAAGLDLQDESVLDGIVAQWADWASTAPDVGIRLRAILAAATPTASAVREGARRHHERHGRRVGNGSLMRTAPVALAYLDDPARLAEVARAISDLTHCELDAGDACVLWSLAIRHAVLEGALDVRVGLDRLPAERRALWLGRFEEAERLPPAAFDRNAGVVQALQEAWSALRHLVVFEEMAPTDADFLRQALENAVRGGGDTDTVAAITGGLAGARWGASAVPAEWLRIVHGWPGLRAADLVRLGVLAAQGGASDVNGWPLAERMDYSADRDASSGDLATLVQHPHDDGVWLGGIGALDVLPPEVDAVVSLCRVGTRQVHPRVRDHLEVWLVDDVGPGTNPNLEFVLVDTVDMIAALRAEGLTVLVHCVDALALTPTVTALYSARHLRVPADRALADILRVLSERRPTYPAGSSSTAVSGRAGAAKAGMRLTPIAAAAIPVMNAAMPTT